MSNVAAKKVFIQIESEAEQQEHLKHQRKSFKVLQGAATDKENLVGRTAVDKLMLLKSATETALNTPTDSIKRKKLETRAIATQTEEIQKDTIKNIIAEDLTSEAAPSEHYWERLAERRRLALDQTLTENKFLHERIEGLEEELNTSKQLLEEARNLVDVLTEMLAEKEHDDDKVDAEQQTAAINDDDNDEDDKAVSEFTATDESSADADTARKQ